MNFLNEDGVARLWLHITDKIGKGYESISESLGALASKDKVGKTDLEQSIQESLNKADSALQSAPVTSVNGQIGAVSVNAVPAFSADNNNQILKVINGEPSWGDDYVQPSYLSTNLTNWTKNQFMEAFNDFVKGKAVVAKYGNQRCACISANYEKGLSTYFMEFISGFGGNYYDYYKLSCEDQATSIYVGKESKVPYMPGNPANGYVLTGDGSTASWKALPDFAQMELITVADIDTICGGPVAVANEVKF